MSSPVRPHRRQPTRLPGPWDSPGKNTGVGCRFLLQCMKVESESEVAQSCLTLSDLMDCSLPGSSIHGIFRAAVLEWGAIAFSTLWSSNSTLGIYPKEIKTQVCTETCSHMLADAFTAIVKEKKCRQPKCPSTGEQIILYKQWLYFYIDQYVSKTLHWIKEPDTKENKLKDDI